ncbi:MAG: hypothetical protein HY077_17770 [Elusimicrobia bacterium]|nr:hypothetical protein [Elusimicrobiota bacterium]
MIKRFLWIAGALAGLGAGAWQWARKTVRPSVVHSIETSFVLPASARGTPSRPAKAKMLDEILLSRNDNDPRLDREFNGLVRAEKDQFRRKYKALAPEKRNERGTIVYLLGKNVKDDADWRFLREVAAEPPCLSLADCSKEGSGPSGMGDDVTLAYPSLVALKAAQRRLEKTPDSKEALAVVAAGRESKMRAVSRLSAQLESRFKPASR